MHKRVNLKKIYCPELNKKIYTAQKMKFSIKEFFSKYDQIRRKLYGTLYFLNGKLQFFSSDSCIDTSIDKSLELPFVIHFKLLFLIYPFPWKYQKTSVYLVISWEMKMELIITVD